MTGAPTRLTLTKGASNNSKVVSQVGSKSPSNFNSKQKDIKVEIRVQAIPMSKVSPVGGNNGTITPGA